MIEFSLFLAWIVAAACLIEADALSLNRKQQQQKQQRKGDLK